MLTEYSGNKLWTEPLHVEGKRMPWHETASYLLVLLIDLRSPLCHSLPDFFFLFGKQTSSQP